MHFPARAALCSIALCGLCGASTGVYAQEACTPELQEMTKANEGLDTAATSFTDENPPPEGQPDICAKGTVEWVTEEFIMKIPEFKSVRREWKMDVPETRINQKRFASKEVIIRCENKKTGQYPEFKCDKGLIPKCKTTWSDIITKVCHPETRDKDIVIGVPEFTMKTRTFSFDNPEITMKDRKFSYGRPKFHINEGCIGADCQEMCRQQTEEQATAYQEKFAAALATSKQTAGQATSKYFTCQVDMTQKQRDELLSNHDSFINVAEATLQAFRKEGLDEEAAKQEVEIQKMREERQKMQTSFDEAITQMQNEQQKAVENIGG